VVRNVHVVVEATIDRTAGGASLLGAACRRLVSAVALARSLYAEGPNFTAARRFEIAHQLVVEHRIIMALLMAGSHRASSSAVRS